MASLFGLDFQDATEDDNLNGGAINAVSTLGEKHPSFQQLKEGLTPEQIELLENVTQVDGFEVDETVDVDDDVEFIDPLTGEKEPVDDEFTLDELGFIDPSNLRTITMEAFCSHRLEHINAMIGERYRELNDKQNQIAYAGYIGRLEANNVNDLLGGALYDNVVMESFTSMPTKVNYNLVMEEMEAGKAALAAGGAIIGAALLYKLVKWCLNAWNKNAVANGSIGQNVKNIQERKDRLKNADNIVDTAKAAFANAQKIMQDEAKNNISNEALSKVLTKVKNVEDINNQAMAEEVMGAIVDAKTRKGLAPVFSNLWGAVITKQTVNINGGSLTVNQEYFVKLQQAAQACQEIANAAKAKIEDIQTTAANAAVNSSGDEVYNKALDVIVAFATVNGFKLDKSNFNAGASEFAQHVLSQVTAKLNTPVPEKAYMADLSFFSEETFAVVSDQFMKDIEEFGKMLDSVTDKNDGWLAKLKGEKSNDSVNVGDAVQRDSRLNEYNKAATNFRGAMNVMRAIHAIRNNVGKGLQAISDALDVE